MSSRHLQVAQMTFVFLLGVLVATGWSGPVFSSAQSGDHADQKVSGTGRGIAEGTPAPAGTVNAVLAQDKADLKRQTAEAGAQASAASLAAAIPPGPRTGEYFLAGGFFSLGVHNLGVIDRGTEVTIEVESTTSGMDLMAVVDEPDVTVNQGRFFADDDSGNGLDPALRFVAPVTGNYVLRVRDLNQRSGFYRYRISVF